MWHIISSCSEEDLRVRMERAWKMMILYPGDGLVAPDGYEDAWQSNEGLQDLMLHLCREEGCCAPKKKPGRIVSPAARLIPSPSTCPSTLVLSSLLQSTSYCMGADSYLFIKLFWNSYSTTSLS